MKDRVLAALMAALVVLVGAAGAADKPEPGSSPVLKFSDVSAQSATNGCLACNEYSTSRFIAYAEGLTPWVSSSMTPKVNRKLLLAFELAKNRVCEIHECHDLFSRLGVDGVETIVTVLYYLADMYIERTLCRRAVAYTYKGAVQTWICRRFSSLSDESAAALLIHKALHHAGLEENIEGGSTSGEIDTVVRRACGF